MRRQGPYQGEGERHVEIQPDVEQALQQRRLITLLSRKEQLLGRARRDVRYKALLDIWLYFHVPLTFALIGALATHIISVFFYW